MGGWAAGLPQTGTGPGGNDEIGLSIPGNTSASDISFFVYGTAAAVAAGVETTILSYVVPAGIYHIIRAEFGGQNIGTFKQYWNATEKDQYITYWGAGMNGSWNYSIADYGGVAVAPGTVITIKILHNRPQVGDFYAKLVLLNIN